MSISVSKTSLKIEIRKLSNFDENIVISFLIEMFRRLRAHSTPFYTPNVVHVVSKQSRQIAKRNHSNFDENSVISFRIDIRGRSNALPIPFYTPNVLHVDFSVENIPENRKTQASKLRGKL
jgi:hypothetical protein